MRKLINFSLVVIKTTFLWALVAGIGLISYAQTTPPNKPKIEVKNDTTRVKIGELEIIIRESENGSVSIIAGTKDGEERVITIKPNKEPMPKEDQKTDNKGKSNPEGDAPISPDGKEEIEKAEKGANKIEEESEVYTDAPNMGKHNHNDNDNDKNKAKKAKKKDVRTRWVLLGLGINNYLQNGSLNLTNEAANLDLNQGKSLNWELGAFRQRINLVKHYLNIDWGLNFDFNHYNFDKNITLNPDTDVVAITQLNESLKKTTFNTSFVKIPLMLRLNTNPNYKNKSLRIGAGGYASYLLGSRTKVVTSSKKTTTTREDFNLNKLRYGINAELGLGPITLYGNYALNGMFEAGKGPELNPLSIGIMIIGF